ncbi:MAG: hypothetical protein EXQ93_07665 [Alphaproteobacteria bacterium]|nr:hypothetical protein [Alphaproteobacteria bacterium]
MMRLGGACGGWSEVGRRAFLSFAAAALAAPHLAWAQPARPYRIALVAPVIPVSAMIEGGDYRFAPMLAELRRLGLVEGQNLIVERHSALGQASQYAELGRAVAASRPDLIYVTASPIIANSAAAANPSIPVVVVLADLLGAGVVTSLARPGGNVTGANTLGDLATEGKRMAMLREAVPHAERFGYIIPRTTWEDPTLLPYERVVRDAAARLGVTPVPVLVENPSDETAYRRAFDWMWDERSRSCKSLPTRQTASRCPSLPRWPSQPVCQRSARTCSSPTLAA